ncbi:hypothetical protein PUN28_005171 [Cardiocondyla obscurior]|uniref:Uncharacterized protein n=1 Tax=Cardiocondyla obscurior TaxID=286306 RepID=A0AAW2GEJ8_9HYME
MRDKLQQMCTCRAKKYAHRKEGSKDRSRRRRQVFVHNPKEEIWHEPYMQTLHREFSDESMLCGSKIELPWRDIFLPAADVRIRSGAAPTADREVNKTETEIAASGEERESTGEMTLPWRADLLITEMSRVTLDDPDTCDSSQEIPWTDLILEKPVEIRPSTEEQTCPSDDVEIPWNEILVPRDVAIKPEKKRRHPSFNRAPNPRTDTPCNFSCTPVCCAKIRPKTFSKTYNKANSSVPNSVWMPTCM